MPKKSQSKCTYSSPNITPHSLYLGTALIGIVSLSVFLYKTQSQPRVLGTSVYLAEKGESEDQAQPEHQSVPNPAPSEEPRPQSQSQREPEQRNLNRGMNKGSLPDDVQIDCEGPDHKHFTTSFGQCKKLNNSFKKDAFRFTQLTQTPPSSSMSGARKEEKRKNLTIKELKGNQPLSLDSHTKSIEFEQDNGQIKVVAKTQDGKEVELDRRDALEKLNDLFADKDLHVATGSGNHVRIQERNTIADSRFPITVNPETHALMVTTPQGEKTVTVLPDGAVQNLLAKRILSSVEQEESTGGAKHKVELTTLQDKPVFVVNGVSSKKMFGVFPLLFAKKAYISTEDGSIVKVEQTPLNTFLEMLSF